MPSFTDTCNITNVYPSNYLDHESCHAFDLNPVLNKILQATWSATSSGKIESWTQRWIICGTMWDLFQEHQKTNIWLVTYIPKKIQCDLKKQANKKFLVPQVRPTLLKLSLEYSLHTLLDPVQHNMVNNQYTLCFVVVFTLIPTVTFYNVYSLDTPSAVMMGASTDHRCLMLSVLLTPRIWKDHRGGSFLFYQKVVHLIVPVSPAKNYTKLGFPSFRRLDNPFLQQRAARSRHIHEPGTLEPLTHLLWLLGMWCLGRRWPELPRCLSHPPPWSTF